MSVLIGLNGRNPKAFCLSATATQASGDQAVCGDISHGRPRGASDGAGGRSALAAGDEYAGKLFRQRAGVNIGENCFVRAARKSAQSQIVVVNHHLF